MSRRRPSSDNVKSLLAPDPGISERDVRKVAMMRRAAGAVDIMLRAYVRPATQPAGKWRPLPSGTGIVRVHSTFNAVKAADAAAALARAATFSAPAALLELYEEIALKPKGETAE